MALELFDHGRMGLVADGELDDGVYAGRTGQRVTQLTPVDDDGHRADPLAVDDARDALFGAQPVSSA